MPAAGQKPFDIQNFGEFTAMVQRLLRRLFKPHQGDVFKIVAEGSDPKYFLNMQFVVRAQKTPGRKGFGLKPNRTGGEFRCEAARFS